MMCRRQSSLAQIRCNQGLTADMDVLAECLYGRSLRVVHACVLATPPLGRVLRTVRARGGGAGGVRPLGCGLRGTA